MEYERYKPKYERPFGRGAFFDYGVAMAKHFAAASRRGRPWRKKILLAPPHRQRAEERWDSQGGNSQAPPSSARNEG